MAKKARYLLSKGSPLDANAESRAPEGTVFRSDNGRRQFLMESAWVVALTVPPYALVNQVGIPSRYSAVAIIPGLALFAFSRITTWWSRKRGKRFSAYDYADFDGD